MARHRRVVQPVFSHRHVVGFAPQMVETTEQIVRRWPDGVALDAAAEMRKLTLGIVGRALFGSELSGEAAGRAVPLRPFNEQPSSGRSCPERPRSEASTSGCPASAVLSAILRRWCSGSSGDRPAENC